MSYLSRASAFLRLSKFRDFETCRGRQAGYVFQVPFSRPPPFEQVDERLAEIFRTEGLYVVLKCSFRREQPRVFGVQTKNNADAEDVETAEAICVGRNVLFEKRVIEFADKFSRVERNLLFAPDIFAFAVYEKLKPVKIPFQVGKKNALRLAVELFRVVHKEFGKIAGYNPLRMLTQGEFRDVFPRLLKGRE